MTPRASSVDMPNTAVMAAGMFKVRSRTQKKIQATSTISVIFSFLDMGPKSVSILLTSSFVSFGACVGR